MATILALQLHEAASMGDLDNLEELILSGKYDINAGDMDWGFKTPLHWACQKGYAECVRLLLDNGAKGTARTETGWTPAHFAAETGKVTVLRALHAANVTIDKKDIWGCSPRRIAEIYDHQECLKFLQQAEQELEEKREKLGYVESSDEEDAMTVISDALFNDEKEMLEKQNNEKQNKEKQDKKKQNKDKLGKQSQNRGNGGKDLKSQEKGKQNQSIQSQEKSSKEKQDNEKTKVDKVKQSKEAATKRKGVSKKD